MVRKYDLVVTSGGIGPTHDGTRASFTRLLDTDPRSDITYASLAKAFNQPLFHNPEVLARLATLDKTRIWAQTHTPEQRTARARMALFPENAEVLFVSKDLWVVNLSVNPAWPAL